jgi:hypothetical protein
MNSSLLSEILMAATGPQAVLAECRKSGTTIESGGSIYFIEVDDNAVIEPSYYLRSSGTNRISKETKYSHGTRMTSPNIDAARRLDRLLKLQFLWSGLLLAGWLMIILSLTAFSMAVSLTPEQMIGRLSTNPKLLLTILPWIPALPNFRILAAAAVASRRTTPRQN